MITMEGKWALSRDPHTQARVLCIDNTGKANFPVVVVGEGGYLLSFTADGSRSLGSAALSLIPYVEKASAYAVSQGGEMMPWAVRGTRFEAETLMNGLIRNNHLSCYSIIKLEQVDETS